VRHYDLGKKIWYQPHRPFFGLSEQKNRRKKKRGMKRGEGRPSCLRGKWGAFANGKLKEDLQLAKKKNVRRDKEGRRKHGRAVQFPCLEIQDPQCNGGEKREVGVSDKKKKRK